MATFVPGSRHPALGVDETERIDYLIVVASMAAADPSALASERAQLETLCTALELSPAGTERVLAAAEAPDKVAVSEIIERLRQSPMRYAVLVDAFSIAYADQQIVPEEASEIRSIAADLGIPDQHVLLVQRYVETCHARGKSPSDRHTATTLVAAGVPAAGLALATAVGVSLATGAGLAAVLGVSSYVSVRWLFRRWRNRPHKPPHA